MKTNLNKKASTLSKYFTRIHDYIDSYDIYTLFLVPTFIGIIFIVVSVLAYKYLSHVDTWLSLYRVTVALGFFIMGFAGIFQIIKKELLVPIKKTKFTALLAILNGIMLVSLVGFWQ